MAKPVAQSATQPIPVRDRESHREKDREMLARVKEFVGVTLASRQNPPCWSLIWTIGCPKSPMWESKGEAWSEDENVSSSGSREGNVCNDALHVIRLYGPGNKISLSLPAGLGAGKGGLQLSHGPGHAGPGNA